MERSANRLRAGVVRRTSRGQSTVRPGHPEDRLRREHRVPVRAGRAGGNTQLTEFYRQYLVRPVFLPLLDEWQAEIQAGGTPGSLFENEENPTTQFADYQKAVEQSEALTALSQEASETSESYVITTIMLAIALFFAGVTSSFRYQPARVFLIVLCAGDRRLRRSPPHLGHEAAHPPERSARDRAGAAPPAPWAARRRMITTVRWAGTERTRRGVPVPTVGSESATAPGGKNRWSTAARAAGGCWPPPCSAAAWPSWTARSSTSRCPGSARTSAAG